MADTMPASVTQGTLEPLEVRIDRLLAEFCAKRESKLNLPANRPRIADLPPDTTPSSRHSPSLNRRKAQIRPQVLPSAYRPIQKSTKHTLKPDRTARWSSNRVRKVPGRPQDHDKVEQGQERAAGGRSISRLYR
ncbi:Hypothetical predicted protein [Pelobates cultripes]|uniref:Uncharacterized protein n=1 Tax=Pelobates cultripes TaxID=61616 RepID=A0AAD1T827_PELCU|nr:Hypothetical predicted protein [Pelobates cultripes]